MGHSPLASRQVPTCTPQAPSASAVSYTHLTAEIQKAKAIAGGMGLVAINAMVATRDYAEAIRTAVAARCV